MPRSVFLIIGLWSATASYACECSKRGSRNFLSNIQQFDLVVFGTSHIDDQLNHILKIEKIYKGVVNTEIINLTSSSAGCVANFIFKEGEKLVLGLTKESDPNGKTFGVMGCTTSVLYVNGDEVKSGNRMQSHPAARLNRIGTIQRSMKLVKLERKIRKRA